MSFWSRILSGTFLLVVFSPGWAQAQAAQFSTESPALLNETTHVVVSLPLVNTGGSAAANVRVTSGTLQGAATTTTRLPLDLGDIAAKEATEIGLTFPNVGLVPGSKHLLTVQGTYISGTGTRGFTVNRFVSIPPTGSIDGFTFTSYGNKNDPLALRARDQTGNVIDFYAQKDDSGGVVALTSIQVKNGAQATFFELDARQRPTRIIAPNGSIVHLTWATDTHILIEGVAPDGTLHVKTAVDVPAMSSATRKRPAVAAIATGCNPASSSNATSKITVTQCGPPGSDARVLMNLDPPLGSSFDLPAPPSGSPGVYAACIPVPDPNSGEQAVNTCKSVLGKTSTVIHAVCNLKGYFTIICDAIASAVALLGNPIAGIEIAVQCPSIVRDATLACLALGAAEKLGDVSGVIDAFCRAFMPAAERAVDSFILQPRASVNTLPPITAFATSQIAPPVGDFRIDIPKCIDHIDVRPIESSIKVGETVTLEAFPFDSNNNPVSVPASSLTWSTRDSAVTVNDRGLVTGVAPGTATVTVVEKASEKEGKAKVEVGDSFTGSWAGTVTINDPPDRVRTFNVTAAILKTATTIRVTVVWVGDGDPAETRTEAGSVNGRKITLNYDAGEGAVHFEGTLSADGLHISGTGADPIDPLDGDKWSGVVNTNGRNLTGHASGKESSATWTLTRQ